jgi:hypothetical protein
MLKRSGLSPDESKVKRLEADLGEWRKVGESRRVEALELQEELRRTKDMASELRATCDRKDGMFGTMRSERDELKLQLHDATDRLDLRDRRIAEAQERVEELLERNDVLNADLTRSGARANSLMADLADMSERVALCATGVESEEEWLRRRGEWPESKSTNPKDVLATAEQRALLHLVPSTSIIHTAAALADGASKYGAYNWRTSGVGACTYVSAAMRHIASWLDGEEDARDSGAHHLAHASACLAILLDSIEVGNLTDDRPPKAPTSDMLERAKKQ